MSAGGVFSETLQNITTAKLNELAKKRESFEKRKAFVLQLAGENSTQLGSLKVLVDGVKACFGLSLKDGKVVRGSSGDARLDTDLRNLDRFLDQARFDPSVSDTLVQQWKSRMLQHLDTQSLKYQYADLYGKLTVEWLTSSGKGASKVSDSEASEVMDTGDDFEEIATKAKLEARQEWERRVFEPAKIDRSAIQDFLTELFDEDDKDMEKALRSLRDAVKDVESSTTVLKPFNMMNLRWTIDGLLASDLLTNDQRQALRDFRSNDVILAEVADVLNMRIAAVENWSWGESVPVEARRQLNGRFNIYMHEDLLQAIFLHKTGVEWSVHFKTALMNFQNNSKVWKHGINKPSALETQRRMWFLNSTNSGNGVQQTRSLYYRAGYFVSQLLDRVDQDISVDEGDEEADFAVFARASRAPAAKRKRAVQLPSKAARRSAPSHGGVATIEEADEEDEDMGFGLYDDEYTAPPPDLTLYKPKNAMDAKQRLLHLLSTDALLDTRLYGDFTCFRSGFDDWYSTLPHETILTVLQFFGVSERWTNIFRQFLQAPLKFTDDQNPPRIRRRGTPGSHAFSDVFSELILFCLDFSVNQETDGQILWRMNNDIWFWSASHERCKQVANLVQGFAKTMGVTLDPDKSATVRLQCKDGNIFPGKIDPALPAGDIRWGMIYLDEDTGRFKIDERMVDKHIEELRRQLKDKERSIFAWVQAYSTYASVFFTTNFGKMANCFGREHLDTMLEMHERIQKTLFADEGEGVSSVVDWLKKQIADRFGVHNIPDGYLFFPTALGGLDVKSPFIGLLQLRDSVTEDPQELFNTFEEAEKDEYLAKKKSYLERKPWEFRRRDGDYRPDNPEEFMPFEEYVRFRQDIRYGFDNELIRIYESLLRQPTEEPVENDGNNEIDEALHRVPNPYDMPTTITSWYNMNPYWKWVTMLYGPEMIQRFGSFEIVDPGLLPMGMVSLFKSGRVSWQE